MTRVPLAVTGLVGIVLVAASCQKQGGGAGSESEALETTQSSLNSVPVYQDPSSSQTINQPSGTSFSVNRLSSANNVIYVDGATYPQTGTGINAAISAAPAGGTVFLPPGTYAVGGTGSDLPIVINKGVNLVGAGWGTVLSVASNTPTNTDVIQVYPGINQVISGVRIADFEIVAAGGVPAQYGIHLNGTNGEIIQALIDHVNIGCPYSPTVTCSPLSSFAIFAEGSGLGQGTPVVSTVQNSLLWGGVSFTNCGDTVRLLNNQITGTTATCAWNQACGGPGCPCINAAFQPGASTFVVSGNNITVAGGIHIGQDADAVQLVGNEIETEGGFVGSDQAVIDVDGTGAANVVIENNSIQIPSKNMATNINGLRVNGAASTVVAGNIIGRALGSPEDIVITSSAQNTYIQPNTWTAGSPIISDSGSNTMIATTVPGAFVLGNGHSLASFDNTGASYQMLETGTDNSVTLFGYHGQSMVSGVNGATYIYDGSGTNTVAATMSPAGVNVGGNSSTGQVTIDGRGALFLASEAACMTTGAGDRFLMWSAGTSQTCQSLCQTINCGGGTASCVQGWTAFTGTQVYRYGDECSSTTNHGNTGKLCCCSGTNCAEPLYH